jgi:hypothetical protein
MKKEPRGGDGTILTDLVKISARSRLRDQALRCLLYLFERHEALPLMGAG